MSAYCIGKLIGGREDLRRQKLCELALQDNLGVRFNLDAEDEGVLEEVSFLRPAGVSFSLTSSPNESELTPAWLQARDVALRALKLSAPGSTPPFSESELRNMDVPQEVLQSIAGTSIGKFLSTVVLDPDVVAGGIAIFDGSVRQIKISTRALCLQELISGFLSAVGLRFRCALRMASHRNQ